MSYATAEGIRRSDLWVINRSPAHFIYHIEHRNSTSKALQFGAAAHKLILEPDTFDEDVFIYPEVNRRTKEGKAIWDTFQSKIVENGLVAITLDEYAVIGAMAEVVEGNRLAKRLLSGEHEKDGQRAAGYCRAVYEAGFSPLCPVLYLPLILNDAIPEEHKSGIDMGRDLLRRAHVLVVCGEAIDEAVKNDIAVAARLNITSTTLAGILDVKRQGQEHDA